MKIRPVRAELFHADGHRDRRTDMAKLIVVSRNFANAPKNTKRKTTTLLEEVGKLSRTSAFRGVYLETEPRENRGMTFNNFFGYLASLFQLYRL
jgi:hypothetical protein